MKKACLVPDLAKIEYFHFQGIYRTIFLGLTTFLRWRRRITTLSYRHITRPLQRSMSYLHPSSAAFQSIGFGRAKKQDSLTRNIFFSLAKILMCRHRLAGWKVYLRHKRFPAEHKVSK